MKSSPYAVWPRRGSPVTIESTWREAVSFTWDSLHPPDFPENAARGRGRPVVVIPGFFSPDVGTARLRAFLKRQEFGVEAWGRASMSAPPRPFFPVWCAGWRRLPRAMARPRR
jgi:hypothetical protein